MEIEKELISVDKCLSHRPGIIPYVEFNGVNSSIFNVDMGSSNGNFGQYVCDFTFREGYYSASNSIGVNVLRSREKSRLRYLDVIRWYNYSQEQIRNGIYAKKWETEEVVSVSTTCGPFEDDVATDVSIVPKWKPVDICNTDLGMYDFTPVNINDFIKTGDMYAYDGNGDIPEDEYILMIPNYEEVMYYDTKWESWWGDSGVDANTAKDKAFGGIYSLISSEYKTNHFIFCRDMDRFVIGRVATPCDITGSKVPNFVYYTEIFDRKMWFVENSAATMNAISNPDTKTEYIIEEWNNRGGGDFYDFLNTITIIYPVYINNIVEGIYFNYSPPIIDINTVIVNEVGEEWMYVPYEFSLINSVPYGMVKPYSVDLNEMHGSTLTPSFITFEDGSNFVESKLETLESNKTVQVSDSIRGVFDEFETDGQLFSVTYCTGTVNTVRTYTSGYNITYVNVMMNGAISVISGTSCVHVEMIDETNGNPPSNTYDMLFGVNAIDESTTASKPSITLKKDASGRTIQVLATWNETTVTTYEWWGANEIDDSLPCGDGEDIKPSERKYRNATIVSCAPYVIGSYVPGNTFYIMARYRNGRYGQSNILSNDGTVYSLSIPYIIYERLNTTTFDDGSVVYDTVIDTTDSVDGNTRIIEYALGVTEGKDINTSGIHYREEFPIIKNKKEIVPIDGVYMGELYYDYLDMDAVSTYVYSSEYGKSRMVRKAVLTGMEVGSIWTESGAVKTMLFTKDSSESLQNEPKFKIEMSFNRGNAAAWEKHFKLSECNTMEDLEKYGNNYFNL